MLVWARVCGCWMGLSEMCPETVDSVTSYDILDIQHIYAKRPPDWPFGFDRRVQAVIT